MSAPANQLNREQSRALLAAKFARHFPILCSPRKAHRCRICGEIIAIAEPCCRWSALIEGEGYGTSHAHPECYKHTLECDWDEGDWESTMPGDISRKDIADWQEAHK